MLTFVGRGLIYATYCLGYYSISAIYRMLTADPALIALIAFI